MTFWSGDTLERRLGPKGIVIPYRKEQIDCAAYTLRMGSEVYVTPDARMGAVRRASRKVMKSRKIVELQPNEQFIIPAGQFAWLLTFEHLNIPKNVVAFISLKTTFKFKGLINVSGFHVDPGFRGKLVYGVYNAGPQEIRLSQGKDLFLIWFADLDFRSDRYFRDNQRQERIHQKQDRIHEDILVPGEILSLQSLHRELSRLDHRLTRFLTYGGAALALLAFVFGAVLRGPVTDWAKEILGSPVATSTTSQESNVN